MTVPSTGENAQPVNEGSLAHKLFYWTIWWVVLTVLTLVYRMRRFGMENVPKHGACLLVANHQSHLDPPAVGVTVNTRQTHGVARVGLFKNPLFGALIRGLNSIPIRNDESDLSAIREVLARLEQGHAVLMFPEGSRSSDGAMKPFKRGVGLLVKRSKCPVIPVAVEGCFDAWPRSRTMPRVMGQRIAVMVGRPIPHEELMVGGPDAALGRLAREIDVLRLDLRRRLRASSRGRVPAHGPGDVPIEPAG